MECCRIKSESLNLHRHRRIMKLIEDKQSLDIEKDFILRSIKTGYKQVKDAMTTSQQLPSLDDLIAELHDA